MSSTEYAYEYRGQRIARDTRDCPAKAKATEISKSSMWYSRSLHDSHAADAL